MGLTGAVFFLVDAPCHHSQVVMLGRNAWPEQERVKHFALRDGLA
jgi:hypothetical protein